MEPRVHYVIVGIFVLLLGSAAVALSLWLAFGQMGYETRGYRVYMSDSVSGLFLDAPVKYRGVQIGRVRDMGLDPEHPERVRLTLDIDASVPIKEDTVATLSFQGVTGIASIDLSGGSRESPELQAAPGERYPVIQAGPSLMTRLDAATTELMENLNRAARDLSGLLNSDTRDRLEQIVEHVELLTATLAERRPALGAGIESFAAAGEQLPAVLQRVDSTLASLEALAEDVRIASQDVQAQVRAGSDSLQVLGGRTLPEVDALLVEMRQLTAGFQRLSERLEEDPRALLFGPRLNELGPGE
ncbi:MAG: MCE family protein [Xanthomonadaceae bacterium]|nr:MCE family protein [Xanthomonadaceae bacterium]